MKAKLILFFLLINIVGVSAQQNSDQYYYAIDGSKWKTSKERDLKEEVFFNKLEINLWKILTKGEFSQERADLLEDGIKTMKLGISDLRKLKTKFEKKLKEELTKENQIKLKREGVVIESAYAKNGELFALKEMRDLYDLSFDHVIYINTFVESISKLDVENIDSETITSSIAKKQKEFTNKLDILTKRFGEKLDTVYTVIASEKTSNTIYYAVDGSTHSSAAKRNAHEQSLLDKMQTKIDRAMDDIANPEVAELWKDYDGVLSANLKSTRDVNNLLKNKLKRNGRFKADNGEEFCTSDLRDCANYSMGMYEIMNKITNDIYESWLQNEINSTKGTTKKKRKIDIEPSDYRDSNGYTFLQLGNMAIKKLKPAAELYKQLNE